MKMKFLTRVLGGLTILLLTILVGLWGLIHQMPGFHPVHLFGSELYYLLPSGKKATGFQTINKHHYYFNQEGVMQKGVVQTEKGLYYFNAQGQQETGLHKGYYFDDQSGQSLQSTFKKVKGQDMYFGTDGKAVKGQVSFSDHTYLFNQQGQLQMDVGFLDELVQDWQATWGGEISIYIKELESGQTHQFQDQTYYPCSIIKLFMLGVIYDQIDQKKLSLDQDHRHLLEEMIIMSSNDAYNQLVSWVGDGDPVKGLTIANQFLERLDIQKTRMHHSLEPSMLHFNDGSGQKNTTTAQDIGNMLEWIHHHPHYQNEMVTLLNQCGDIFALKSGTPDEVTFAHKSGEALGNYHDGGIVYLNHRPYIVVVCTKNVTYVQSLFAQVASELYTYEKQLNDLTGS